METVRTAHGPRQRTLCYLGELNSSAQGRWLKTVEVFNQQGDPEQLKLFPSHIEPSADDRQVARVLVNRVRLERTRQFGACFLGWEMWKRLALDRFFEQAVDDDPADVPWSRVAALPAFNRLCADRNKMERRLGKIQARHSQVNDLFEVALRDTAEGVRLRRGELERMQRCWHLDPRRDPTAVSCNPRRRKQRIPSERERLPHPLNGLASAAFPKIKPRGE